MKANKRLGAAIASIVLLLSFVACSGKGAYKPGTYEGEGQGHGGAIKVAVSVDSDKITKIDVTESAESDFSEQAVQEIIKRVLDKNSAEIDSVSGASETSEGLIAAIAAALSKAQTGEAVKIAGTKGATGEVPEDMSCDVVIVGAGGAGLSSALEAHDHGASVILVEKLSVIGGNTNYATGGLNAAETAPQKALDIQDSVETFYEDTMKGGKNLNNPALVHVLTERSAGTVDWLIGLGGDFSDVGKLGGATNPRAHRPSGGAPVGNHLVKILYDAVQKRGINVQTNSKVVALLKEGDAVSGVEVETKNGNYTIRAKAVIITTGGFGANQEKVVAYKPELKGFGTTNQPGATGDALDFIKDFDVALVDMEQIQTHPTVVPVKNTMITEAVRGNGAILVNREASRFISEMQTRDVVSDAELAQTGGTAFLLFDQGVRDSLSAIENYVKAGLLTEGDTIADVAQKMGLDAATLQATVDRYNGFVNTGVDTDFDRSDLPRELVHAPYYMVEVGPAVHHTMGGIKINTDAQVITTGGSAVPGLYAAGEVTGGIHGANRLGGNSLSDITTFGRIAGTLAAEFAAK
jgi:fumarate reductase flavoprotein subunit